MEIFGSYIRNLRLQKGWNQTQLAAKIGVDSGGLSKIENGKKELNENKLMLLAKELEVGIDELKAQYFSDKIAKYFYKYKCPETVLNLAVEKVKYIESINAKRAKI